jgi:ArsR family transcriptional regulator
MRNITDLFSILSEPTRLRILNLLFQSSSGGLCVCELEEVLQMSQSRISQQLKLLRAANLVSDERVGQWIIYRLQPQDDEFQQKILETLRLWLENNEIAQTDLKRLQQCLACGTKRQKACCLS